VSRMEINDRPLLDRTLGYLRLLLGGGRVEEIGEIVAALLDTEARSVEERLCFAEYFRLYAEFEALGETVRGYTDDTAAP
jgi:hypothetical protein